MAYIGPFGFSAGLDTKSTLYNLPPNSLYTCQGLRPVNNSLIEKFGTAVLNASPLTGVTNQIVQGILPNTLTPAVTYAILAICDGKTYGLTAGGVATDLTGSAAFNAGSNNQVNNSDSLNGIMVISDAQGGAGQLNQWSGSGNVTTLAGSPDGVWVRTVNNFMFTFERTLNPSRVWWSGVGDPTTWPANSFVDFRKKDGDSIRAIHFIGTDLYIFKQYSIGKLSTLSTAISGVATLGPLATVTTGIGAAGAASVDKLPDGRLIFLASNSHAYIFDGNILTDISDQPFPGPNCQALLDALAPATFGDLPRICVYPPRNEVWFIGTTSPVTNGNPGDRILIYNYKDNNWTQVKPTVGTHNVIAWVPSVNGAVGPGFTNGGVFNGTGNLLTAGNGSGQNNGTIFIQDSSLSTTNVGTIQWNASIPLAAEGRTFIPRSLLIIHQGTSASNSFFLAYGFDGGTIGNSKNILTSTNYVRTVIPIVVPTTGASAVGPSTMQIQVTDSSGGGITFEPFYLSDEILI